MYLVKDINVKYGTLYEKIFDIKKKRKRTIGALGFIKKSSESGFTYFMVMNQDGRLSGEINFFLNVVIKSVGYKSREKAYNALKVLYSYCLIFDIEVEDFTEVEVNKLIHFLYGGKIEGKFLSLDISTTRHTNTIRNYLNIYNKYYKYYSNKQSSPFENTLHLPIPNYIENSSKSHLLAQGNHTKYIKEIQFERMQKIIRKAYTIREELIIHLMYFYGLRIGEVLGITLEDLKFDDRKYKIIIRNRLTDRPWQKAKGVLTPTNEQDYSRDIFNEVDSGFQVIYVTKITFEMFDNYIESTRTTDSLMSSNKRLQNLNKECIADKIDTSSRLIENQYIFLSKNLFKPLTSAGWNSVLREIFQNANITIDQNKRKINLNHRFRHAFAMNLVKEELSPIQLAKRMRHKSVSSSYKYYNPDEEDQFKILEKYKESIGDKYDFRL